MRNRMFGFFLHYGISVVLVVMLVSIAYMMQVIEIDNKIQVDVVYEHDGKCYCYLPKDVYCVRDKNLPVCFGEGDTEVLIVLETSVEGQYLVCCVDFPASFDNRLRLVRNRKATAYISRGKERVFDLVFKKWFDKFR